MMLLRSFGKKITKEILPPDHAKTASDEFANFTQPFADRKHTMQNFQQG